MNEFEQKVVVALLSGILGFISALVMEKLKSQRIPLDELRKKSAVARIEVYNLAMAFAQEIHKDHKLLNVRKAGRLLGMTTEKIDEFFRVFRATQSQNKLQGLRDMLAAEETPDGLPITRDDRQLFVESVAHYAKQVELLESKIEENSGLLGEQFLQDLKAFSQFHQDRLYEMLINGHVQGISIKDPKSIKQYVARENEVLKRLNRNLPRSYRSRLTNA